MNRNATRRDGRTPRRLVKWLAKWFGRYCVYGLPGCTCRLSPTYMAFYSSLVASLAAQDEKARR